MKKENENEKKDNEKEKEKKDFEIIVVNSVKGGCGKTTTAITEALRLSSEGKCCCVIDLDFLGTSIERTIDENVFVKTDINNDKDDKDSNVKERAKAYLNDYILDNHILLDDIFSTIEINKHSFYLIAADPSEKAKEKFRIRNEFNYVPEIEYGAFKYSISQLLKKLKNVSEDDDDPKKVSKSISDKINVVIIDMPPNSDSYTEALFQVLLSKPEKKEKMKISKKLILSSTADRSHLSATFDWLQHSLKNEHLRESLFDEYEIRINDIIGVYFDKEDVTNSEPQNYESFKLKIDDNVKELKNIPINVLKDITIRIYGKNKDLIHAVQSSENWKEVDYNAPAIEFKYCKSTITSIIFEHVSKTSDPETETNDDEKKDEQT